ncbi:response regulator [Anaerolineales bacterium HSG25]|nr:response regulator [Anaerolineales bacterium HSG25]
MEQIYNVLIVDDELGFLEKYSDILRRRGFEVQTAQNGLDGLEKLRQDQFDVAILDIRMPKMDGIEIARLIQVEDIDTGVIVVTGHGERNEAVKALNYGVDAWFDKSRLDMGQFVDKVRQVAEVMSPEEIHHILSAIPEYETA